MLATNLCSGLADLPLVPIAGKGKRFRETTQGRAHSIIWQENTHTSLPVGQVDTTGGLNYCDKAPP